MFAAGLIKGSTCLRMDSKGEACERVVVSGPGILSDERVRGCWVTFCIAGRIW